MNRGDMLHPVFGGCGEVDFAFYSGHFPDVHSILVKRPQTLSVEDTCYILARLTTLGDFAVVCRVLPSITVRYAETRIMPRVELLYARLLDWRDRWSPEQYLFLNDCVMSHWASSLSEHKPPNRLAVFDKEVSFLLVWLTDHAPVMPFLSFLAEMYRIGDVGAAEWDGSHWMPFIQNLQANPIRTVLHHATADAISELSAERTSQIKRILVSSGLLAPNSLGS